MATTRTRRPRTDRPPPIPIAIGGTIVVLLLVGAVYMATQVYSGVPGRHYSTLYVDAPQVGNLLSHDPVRVHGAQVGQVIARSIDADGRPRIKLQLNNGVTVRRGARATFRANGLLGARFVDLTLGDGPALRSGATLTGGTGSYTYGLPEVLGTFDDQTRGALGDTIDGLGQGLAGEGSRLNDSIHIASSQAENFRTTALTILRRKGAAAHLIPALSAAVAPLDRNRTALARDSGLTADALAPFVSERDATRDTLQTAPAALRAVVPGLSAGTQLVNQVDRLANAANRTLPYAPAGLTNLRDLLTDGRAPLKNANALVKAVKPAVPGVLKITAAANPVLQPLQKMLSDAHPILSEVGKYDCDIRMFGSTMRSMTGYTQPGEGPAGPAGAFRLQAVAPLSTDVVGVKDRINADGRHGVLPPCYFHPTEYPQYTGADHG